MKTSAAVKLVGSLRELAQALGLSTQAIYKWKGEVPKEREEQLRKERPELFGARR